jgi:hypothetical protein
MTRARHMASMGGEGAYWVFVGRTEGRWLLGRPSHTWEDNIKMYVKESEWKACPGFCCLKIGT